MVDPTVAGFPGREGPTSLVLLSEGKRQLRGQLLQRMMKLRGEIEGVLRSAAKLGITPNGAEKKDDNSGSGAQENEGEQAQIESNGSDHNSNTTGMKRLWTSESEALAVVSKKKKSRFKILYRKK